MSVFTVRNPGENRGRRRQDYNNQDKELDRQYIRMDENTADSIALMTNKHILRSLSPDMLSAHCTWCGINTPVIKRKQKYHCINDITTAVKKAPDKWAARTKAFTQKTDRLARQYNLTYEKYLTMLDDTNYSCGICDEPFTKDSPPHIDHNHVCCPGKQSCGECIRGLLCRMCNSGIGYFKDNAQNLVRASVYLTGV